MGHRAAKHGGYVEGAPATDHRRKDRQSLNQHTKKEKIWVCTQQIQQQRKVGMLERRDKGNTWNPRERDIYENYGFGGKAE